MKLAGILSCLIFAVLRLQGQLVESQQQARLTGEGGPGHCILEVEVDGVAEVSVKDQEGVVRTLSGQPSRWRRFECNQPMPRNPAGFQMRGIDGRGQVRLVHDPSRGGIAVVRIEDPKGGSDTYRFALEWRGDNGGSNYPPADGYRPGGQNYGGDQDRDRDRERRERRERIVRSCASAVQDRLSHDDYQNVQIINANVEDRPGRRGDRVLGRASGQGRWGSETFLFSCGVNFEDGIIRGLDVVPQ